MTSLSLPILLLKLLHLLQKTIPTHNYRKHHRRPSPRRPDLDRVQDRDERTDRVADLPPRQTLLGGPHHAQLASDLGFDKHVDFTTAVEAAGEGHGDAAGCTSRSDPQRDCF